MKAETLQRLRDLAASPEMMPNMPTLRRDLAEMLAAYDAAVDRLSYLNSEINELREFQS